MSRISRARSFLGIATIRTRPMSIRLPIQGHSHTLRTVQFQATSFPPSQGNSWPNGLYVAWLRPEMDLAKNSQRQERFSAPRHARDLGITAAHLIVDRGIDVGR